ncbi:MAG: DHH family phosphoesterase [Opitutaceae bacterium]
MHPFFPDLSPRFASVLVRLTGKRIAVIGHTRPDGDCIGSQVALARVLAARGIEVVCVNGDPVPRRLAFLATGMKFLRTDAMLPIAAGYEAIFVDCADHGRAGERLRKAFPSPLVAIDHHISHDNFAAENFLDTAASATCEILAGIFLDNKIEIDTQTAQALYAGILTDTGQFRFNSTTCKTFDLAGELLSRGVVPSDVAYEVYERESLGKVKLLQRFLSTLTMECGGRVCIGRLPVGVFEETGTSGEDTEGLVDYARMIDGVDVGVLIEERADKTIKASLRAKSPVFRVDTVAAQFGGGGHACAAGLNLKQNTENFYQRLVAALETQIAAVDAAKSVRA